MAVSKFLSEFYVILACLAPFLYPCVLHSMIKKLVKGENAPWHCFILVLLNCGLFYAIFE